MTSRHQAVHDVLTRSTVQMRDLAKAQPYHFRGRRDPQRGMPSQIRRAAVIAVYLLACFMLYAIVLATLAAVGLLSRRCIQTCSAGEFAILIPLWVIWGGISVWAALLGWQGRLWGVRAQR
jgi:hypothetical protein